MFSLDLDHLTPLDLGLENVTSLGFCPPLKDFCALDSEITPKTYRPHPCTPTYPNPHGSFWSFSTLSPSGDPNRLQGLVEEASPRGLRWPAIQRISSCPHQGHSRSQGIASTKSCLLGALRAPSSATTEMRKEIPK